MDGTCFFLVSLWNHTDGRFACFQIGIDFALWIERVAGCRIKINQGMPFFGLWDMAISMVSTDCGFGSAGMSMYRMPSDGKGKKYERNTDAICI